MLASLEIYRTLCGERAPFWNHACPQQADCADRIIALMREVPGCFVRSTFPAHVTGSAFIVDEDFKNTLLVHHRKLGKWMQPGGHSDGESQTHRVSLREANEETGLLNLEFLSLPLQPSSSEPVPFDVDIHTIPAHGNEPAHEHFDLRYLLVARRDETPVTSEESLAVAWVPLDRIAEWSGEESILRMVEKVRRMAPGAAAE